MTPQATIEEAEELRRAPESDLDEPRIEIATTDARGFFKALNEPRKFSRTGRTSPASRGRSFGAYYESFNPPPAVGLEPAPPRRALPAPFDSPPFPSAEYQGYPLVGVPYSTPPSPLMKALTGTPVGDFMNAHRLYLYGWINAAANVSSSSLSNSPESYWLGPNTALPDQLAGRLPRPGDRVPKEHVDWGGPAS